MDKPGRLIAVVGPSGVGKDSVMRAMQKVAPRIALARRVITRPSSAGGEDFDTVSIAEFEAKRNAGAFALSWEAHGLHYGIPSDVDEQLAAGKDVLTNLSRSVLQQAKARYARFEVLSFSAQREVLKDRLMARGRENPEQIAQRLERASFAIPEGIEPLELDNSGALEDTVRRALDLLYPVRA